MERLIYDLLEANSAALLGGAVVICAATAWLMLLLLQQASHAAGSDRLRRVAVIALVGGLGVWTTHFVAMLGFRPALAFGYDPRITALSAIIGIGLIGLPIAACALTTRPSRRALCGAVAGAGIAAMHYTGMGALRGCTASHTPGITPLSIAFGTLLLAAALRLAHRPDRRLAAGALIVLAVCLTHFTAMAGLSLTPLPHVDLIGADQTSLGAIVVTTALGLLAMASAMTFSVHRLEQQQKASALLGAALDNMSNGLLVIGPLGSITLFNDRLLGLFQIGPGDVAVGMRWDEFLRRLGRHLGWTATQTRRVIANHADWFAKADATNLEDTLPDGRMISIACRPMADGGAVMTYIDVTGERQAQKAVERLAFIDPLTELRNRRAFQKDLSAALDGGKAVALLLIDLDRFKSINDTLGHAIGDEVLILVGRRLKGACLRRQKVYRLGGDELAIIWCDAGEAEVAALCETIIGDTVEPLPTSEKAVTMGFSIGVATSADTRDAETLVRYADLALFKAKAQGRRQSHRYAVGMLEAATEKQSLEADMRAALETGAFSVVYQPLCRVSDRRIVGFEALIRWNHPTRGFVGPDRFVPLAEETGLIGAIGAWVLAAACREAASWPADVHVAVNASPVQLRSKTFPLQVATTLAASGLSPSRLGIELTETALVADGDQIAVALQALRDLGVRVAMDDFGTGYSSFAHLVDFGLDTIKIDRSFVQAAPEKPSAMAVLKAVVQLARDLGVTTIGEGVETAEQLDMLKDLGCTKAQGYLIGRPLSAEAARDLLARQDGSDPAQDGPRRLAAER